MSSEVLQRVGHRYPSAALVDSAAGVLIDPDIDIVSIASYDNAHAEQVLTAIRHGKHVFVEKPLCMNEREAREIRNALAAHPEVRLSSNLILRLSPRFQFVRRLVLDGDFGSLFHVEGDYHYGRIEKLTHGWRGEIDYYSVILGGAVHLIDALLWITQDQIVEVAAFANKVATADTAFRHHDMVVAILRFRDGLVGKITANFGCVCPHGHGLSIFGTKATFINGPNGAVLHKSRAPAEAPAVIDSPHPGARKGDLIKSFVASIIDDAPADVSENDVFRTMSVCLAIERAVHSGRVERVEYL
jgi:predicted dehydrogenase